MAAVRLGGAGLDEETFGRAYDHRVATRLLRYVLPYKRWTLLAMVSMAGYIATTLIPPLIIAWAINSFIVPPEGQAPELRRLHLAVLAFFANALFNMGSNYLQYYSLTMVAIRVLYDLRVAMFRHLQAQAISFYDVNEVGRLMSRVQNDVLQLSEFLALLILALADLVTLVGMVAVMLWMNVFLTLVSLAALPVLGLIMAFWQRHAKGAFVWVRQAISTVNASLQENISGVRVIQSLNRQEVNFHRFDRINEEHLKANLHAARLAAVLLPIVELLTVSTLAIVLVLGGIMVFEGRLEIGFLIAFFLYVQRFFEPVRTITMQYTGFQRAMASGARIFELLDIQPTLLDKPGAPEMPPIQGEIRFQNVHFGYTPGREVLQDITLHIKPGQTVALVGRTGAGKTTMVSLLERFYDVDAGRILIDGWDLREVTRQSLARQMSMVLQEPFLYSTTVKENIRYRHRQVTDEEIVEAAKAVGAHDFIMGLEQGYDTVLQQRGGNLSLGQRQLISFARALVANPRILILDEATASIDSPTERLIQEALRTILRGRTALIIAHRLSTITGADLIVVLEEGRIVETGTHAELLTKGGLYAQLYALNLERELDEGGPNLTAERAGADLIESLSAAREAWE